MKNTVVLLIASLFSTHASAGYVCHVTVQNILIYSEGTVNVLHSGRGDYTNICNLNVERNGVSPTVCAMWTATLQSIKKKNGLAAFNFSVEGSCASMPTYGNSPYPYYVGDVTP